MLGAREVLLVNLKHGEKATIKDLSKLNRLVKRRLLDFGVMEGEEILVKNRMPFHGPFVLEHGGQSFGIRYKEAAYIGIVQA